MSPRAILPLAALLGAALAGCATTSAGEDRATDAGTASVPDPLAVGARPVEEAEYGFGVLVADDPTLFPYRYQVPLHGQLYLPKGDDAVPVVLLMHGRHGTCAVLGFEAIGPGTCPNAAVVEPVDSYLGYGGLARNLASHGYAVASLDANAINDRDLLGDAGANARAQLVLRTLDELASVNATGRSSADANGVSVLPRQEVPQAQGRLDLSRVGLMGHSRGGEGVARAVTLDLERGGTHGLDAVFALAPTDFARWAVPGVAFATLLPYCDGDVYNLQGAWMYDDARRLEPAAPRHQVLAMGANHNFYNTVWTGDDWGPGGKWCGSEADGSGRDSPEEQRAHGDGLMASFFRLHVGGEAAFAPLWDGAGSTVPASLCPGRPSCDGRLYASALPVDRLELAPDGMPTTQVGLDPRACGEDDCSTPFYGAAERTFWDCHGDGHATFPVDGGLAGWDALSLRIGNRDDGNPLRVWVDGVTTTPTALASRPTDGEAGFAPRPGDTTQEPGAKTVLNEVRFRFAAGQDLAGVTAITVHCSGAGGIEVADIMLV